MSDEREREKVANNLRYGWPLPDEIGDWTLFIDDGEPSYEVLESWARASCTLEKSEDGFDVVVEYREGKIDEVPRVSVKKVAKNAGKHEASLRAIEFLESHPSLESLRRPYTWRGSENAERKY